MGATSEIWLLDSAILVQSGTILELENCHIKLSDRCRDNFIRSANCGMGIETIEPMSDIHIIGYGNAVLEGADDPRATGDSAKTLGERSYGSDAGVEWCKPDWRLAQHRYPACLCGTLTHRKRTDCRLSPPGRFLLSAAAMAYCATSILHPAAIKSSMVFRG